MMITFLVWLINLAVQLITLLVIAHVVLSYFMSPYHPIRQTIGRLVEPMLAPLRRLIPPVGGTLDITPIILLVLVQLLGIILASLLRAI